MAYGNNTQRAGGYGNNKPATANSTAKATIGAAVAATKGESDTIQVPLYFTKPKREGTKLVASSIPLEQDVTVTIPAGYSMKVFTKGGTSKNGKRLPDFDLVIQPALVKKA